MQASQYIVIGQTAKTFNPKIVLRTDSEAFARAHARRMLQETKCDTYVYDYVSGVCILALTNEPAEG
jgi:hypothetical protein